LLGIYWGCHREIPNKYPTRPYYDLNKTSISRSKDPKLVRYWLSDRK